MPRDERRGLSREQLQGNEGTGIWRPQGLGRGKPGSPPRAPFWELVALLIPWLWTSSVQNHERIISVFRVTQPVTWKHWETNRAASKLRKDQPPGAHTLVWHLLFCGQDLVNLFPADTANTMKWHFHSWVIEGWIPSCSLCLALSLAVSDKSGCHDISCLWRGPQDKEQKKVPANEELNPTNGLRGRLGSRFHPPPPHNWSLVMSETPASWLHLERPRGRGPRKLCLDSLLRKTES